MKDFLSIKEFSETSGVEQTTLRYWDDIGLFSPTKRDPENNYRYYTPEQIIAVNFITVLSNLNISLKTIGELDSERTPEKIVKLIEQQEKLLDTEMRRLRERYSIIHRRRELIYSGIKIIQGFHIADGFEVSADETESEYVDLTKIFIMHRDEAAIMLGPRNIFTPGDTIHEPYADFCRQAETLRINLSFPIGGFYEDMESFLKAPTQPDYFFSTDPTGNLRRTAGQYLMGFTRGDYGDLGNLPERMAAYAEENSVSLVGPVYSMYLHDEICMKDPSQYLMQICVRASKEAK